MPMNIFQAESGNKVTFEHPTAGWKGDVERGRKFLLLGEEYTIHSVDIHQTLTTVYLEEFPGEYFNSVQFEDVE